MFVVTWDSIRKKENNEVTQLVGEWDFHCCTCLSLSIPMGIKEKESQEEMNS